MKEKFLEAKKIIDRSQKILLVSHTNPDGDAFGSMLALKLCFDDLGKQSDVFCAGQIPGNLKFLPGADVITNRPEANYDLVIGVDYGSMDHLEIIAEKLALPAPAISFDHHPLGGEITGLAIVNADFSSTCEIIFRFFEANNLELTKDIATCLLTGILADTWGFRHPNTTADTLQVVGQLLKTGASVNKVYRRLTQNNVSGKSFVWGRALAKMKLDQAGFVFCALDQADLASSQPDKDDLLAGLSATLCMVPEAKFSVVLIEKGEGRTKGSLRSLPDRGVDVSRLAKAFGGGGHVLSSGFTVTDMEVGEILAKIRELIKEF